MSAEEPVQATPVVPEVVDEPAAEEEAKDELPEVDLDDNCIALYGLERWDGHNKVSKAVNDLGISFVGLRKRKGQPFALVTFKDLESKKAAWGKLQEAADESGKKLYKVKEPKVKKNKAKIAARKLKKRKQRDEKAEQQEAEKKARIEAGEEVPEEKKEEPLTAKDIATPLWKLSYPEQLAKKQHEVSQILKNTCRKMKRTYPDLTFPHSEKGLICKMDDIIPSPVVDGYRNKCDFTIGKNLNGELTVGFTMGRFADGIVTVESPEGCPNMPQIAITVAGITDKLVRQSGYEPWDKLLKTGVWRTSRVRISESNKQVMVCLQVSTNSFRASSSSSSSFSASSSAPVPMAEAEVTSEVAKEEAKQMDVEPQQQQQQPVAAEENKKETDASSSSAASSSTVSSSTASSSSSAASELPPIDEAQVAAFRKMIIDHYTTIMDEKWSEANEGYKLHSLMIQVYNGHSEPVAGESPFELLYGQPFVQEQLMGINFRISPEAFFQVNTKGAETLYSTAATWAECKETTTLFDICCGTGTIGLTMAKKVGKVVGLELVPEAVEDAKQNAAENGIPNAVYVCGRAEETLPKALAEHALTEDVVGILDPPRSGLHHTTIKALRKCDKLKRLVYISCNPKSLADNLQKFLQPPTKMIRGKPFTAVKAVPVDMFPHTAHCEMILLLTRE